jgi:hypothetical protein
VSDKAVAFMNWRQWLDNEEDIEVGKVDQAFDKRGTSLREGSGW